MTSAPSTNIVFALSISSNGRSAPTGAADSGSADDDGSRSLMVGKLRLQGCCRTEDRCFHSLKTSSIVEVFRIETLLVVHSQHDDIDRLAAQVGKTTHG
jgi:hypothetical protein